MHCPPGRIHTPSPYTGKGSCIPLNPPFDRKTGNRYYTEKRKGIDYKIKMAKKILLAASALLAIALILLPLLIPDVETITLDGSFRKKTAGTFIRLSDGYTWYELHGNPQKPAVVFIHGFTIPSVIWHYTAAPVHKSGFTTLRFDNFGRGFSDRPDTVYNAALYVRQIRELLHRLGIRRPVALIGHSQGAAIACAFALRHPGRVSSLCLINPVGYKLPLPLYQKIITLPLIGDYLARLFLDEAIETTFTTHFPDPAVRRVIHPRYHRQRRIKGFRRAFMSGIRQNTLEKMEPVYEKVGQLKKPILLFWGTEDTLSPYRYHKKIRKLLPDAVFRPVRGAGHNGQIDGRNFVNPLLIRFLKKNKR